MNYNIDIINGAYTTFEHNVRSENITYHLIIHAKAGIICNKKVSSISSTVSCKDQSNIIKYKELIKRSRLKPYTIETNYDSSLPFMAFERRDWRVQYKYADIRNMYRDAYVKREILIKHYHNYLYSVELKYFLLKEYFIHNFDHFDKCIIYDTFDILHYLSNILCYWNEIGAYTTDLNTLSEDSDTVLERANYKCEPCEYRDSIYVEFNDYNYHLYVTNANEEITDESSTDEGHYDRYSYSSDNVSDSIESSTDDVSYSIEYSTDESSDNVSEHH